jgi:hypothetical protein
MADAVVYETKNGSGKRTLKHIPPILSYKRRNVAIFFLFHPKTKGRIALGPYDSYSGLLSLENAH